MQVFDGWKSWLDVESGLQASLESAVWQELEQAFRYAELCHKDQMRPNGEPYWMHLLQVLEVLTDGAGIRERAAMLAALLHDVVEDTGHPIAEIEDKFGGEVARIVDWVTIKDIDILGKVRAKEKYLLDLKQAPREVLQVKLCDRISNTQKLYELPDTQRQVDYYCQTVKYLVPLAQGQAFFEDWFEVWQLHYAHLNQCEN